MYSSILSDWVDRSLGIITQSNRRILLSLYQPRFEVFRKISKTQFKEERVKNGIISIVEFKVFAEALPTPYGYSKTLKLKAEGLKDFIDLLLYETAEIKGLKMLTRDRELIEFVKRTEGEAVSILQEETL